MKHIFLFPLSVCIFLALACDASDLPITDPTEMYEKAVALIQEQSFKQAKPLLEQAITSFRDLPKTSQLTEALTFLVQTRLELGEYRAAIAASEQAAVVMRKEGDVHGEIKLALLEGDLYAAMGMPALAISRYRSAFSSATAFDDARASAEAQLSLAAMLKKSGDWDEALDMYKNVLAQSQMKGDHSHLAAALHGIGSIYRTQHRYVEAINSFTQGLASVSRSSDPVLAARLQMEIGVLHSHQNNNNAALRDFRDAINILRRARTGKNLETVLLFRLGNIYDKNTRLIEAKRYYSEALELARAQGDRIAEGYLYIFVVRCNFALMTPEQQQAQREKLWLSYDQIAKKFQECNHITGEGYLYTLRGKEYEAAGDLGGARSSYAKAVTLDQNSMAEYFDEELHTPYQTALDIDPAHDDWYRLLSALLVKGQRQDEALKILEFMRVRQLGTTFQNLDLTLRHPKFKEQTRDILGRLRKAKMLEAEFTSRSASRQRSSEVKEMNALRAELEAMKQTLRKESRQIVLEHPNYETLVMSSPVETASIRKNIPSGTLAIEFLPTDDLLYIFALTRTQLIIRTSAIQHDSLIQLMSEYKKLLQDPAVYSGEAGDASVASMTRFAMLSTQLFELLLRPVDDLFERSLVIVADREMDGFPFHAIERQDRRGNVKYVIELTSVDYVPSLASLRYRAASTARLQNIVAFGNPTGKNWSVDYELRDIRSFFKEADVMVGLEASWDNLKSVKADILLLSTEFSHRSAERPLGDMVLSNGLMVEQSTTVSFEKLSEHEAIPVMILSNHYGEGIGLTAEHALLLRMNGSSDIFFNEWQADRKSGKFFSEYFFTHLANGLAPGDAYRQALLNLIRTRDVSHPRSWGQFFHFGVG